MNPEQGSEAPVVSVIDIGSNTIKFLVAGGPDLHVLEESSEDVRIGTGMGLSDEVRLLPEVIDSAVACVEELRQRAAKFHPARQMVVATSAVRDAVNGQDFVHKVKDTSGLDVRILSGEEEARYVGRGVSGDPNIDPRKPFYLMDLGGGSLELLEYCGGIVRQKVSLPLGVVRLKEKLVRHPEAAMSDQEMAEISEYVTEMIDASGFAFRNPAALVGTGGSLAHARYLIGWTVGLKPEKSSPILGIADMRALTRRICSMTLEERRWMKHLPSSRADIMNVAMIVLTTVMELATAGAVIQSYYNLRYGMADEMLTELAGVGSAN